MIRLDTLGTLALRGVDGNEFRSVLTQPKRLAVLCYLAAEAPRGFQRRDHLFGLFWPELSQAQARQALRQALYFLRHALGENIVTNRGSDEIGIVAESLRCDVSAFTDLCAAGRLEEALTLYRGDFLSGFFVDDSSPAFDHWLYATRDSLRQSATDAAWALADAASSRGTASEAAHWARHASRLDPDNETSIQRLITLLDRHGDRAGALRAYAEFAETLATEFAAEPSAETSALIEDVRGRTTNSAAALSSHLAGGAPVGRDAQEPVRSIDTATLPEPASGINDSADPVRRDAGRASREPDSAVIAVRTSARIWSPVALSLAVAAAVILFAAQYFRANRVPPTMAVGWIQDPSGADTGAMTRTFAELLATQLGRVPGMHVISRARLYEILGQLGNSNETPSSITAAARRAGATQVVEAVISHNPDGSTQLDLGRINLASGEAERTYSLRASTVSELADRAAGQLASDYGLSAPRTDVASVTTSSLTAQRLYEEGLRSYYRRDVPSAVRLFHAALKEDTTFAMAAYYAGLGEQATDGLASRRDLTLALRLSNRASDRERLIIRQTWAYATNSPSQLAIAESLVARFPEDPGGELALGRALGWSGRFLDAVPHLRRVVHMDTLTLRGDSPLCDACDALESMIASYIAADSMSAAERVAREWTLMQPRVQEPWWYLATTLARRNRYDSALAVEQRAERVSADHTGDVVTRATIDIGAALFAQADRLLGDLAQDGNIATRSDALWWSIISLRNQGRLSDALALADSMVRIGASETAGFSTPRSLNAVSVAQIQFEMGRYSNSAAAFDSIASYRWKGSPGFASLAPGLIARHRIWMTTQMATALARQNDTTHLKMARDSITAWASQSAFFRDRALVHYVRGLVAESRGRLADAEKEFRAARVSPIDGYNRTSLELAATLMAEGRPREAIPVLQAPMHGSLEASNYYLTQTELHAALGDAFDSAGEPDSAIAHYQRVLSAWQHADPVFAPRLASIRKRIHAMASVRGSASQHRNELVPMRKSR